MRCSLLLLAMTIVIALVVPISASGQSADHRKPSCNSLCKRIKAKRHFIHTHYYRFCNTWKCVKRVDKKRAKRHPFSYATASWYGPGFYGHRTACGQTLTPGLAGVAHKTLACGTKLVLCVRRCATTYVIDRGPYVAGREFDLTAATRNAIGAGSLSTVRWRIGVR